MAAALAVEVVAMRGVNTGTEMLTAIITTLVATETTKGVIVIDQIATEIAMPISDHIKDMCADDADNKVATSRCFNLYCMTC